jgi:Rrf2 family nitric oxide-sensitive transcriptional repressor
MFDDALGAFISVLDQHTLAELATQRSPVGIAGATDDGPGGTTRSSRVRAKKPATRGLRRS